VIIRIIDAAETELRAAKLWYSEQAPEQMPALALKIRETLNRIAHFPRAHPEVKPGVRRALLSVFPYGFLYYADLPKKTIWILAFLNTRLHPEIWKNATNRRN
jgi:plasmid stabilization system protein ParE